MYSHIKDKCINLIIGKNGTGKSHYFNSLVNYSFDKPKEKYEETILIHKDITIEQIQADSIKLEIDFTNKNRNVLEGLTEELKFKKTISLKTETQINKREFKKFINQQTTEFIKAKSNSLFVDGISKFNELGDGNSRLALYSKIASKYEKKRKRILFLFDEPEIHLHSENYNELVSILKRLMKNHTVVVSTHSSKLVYQLTKEEYNLILTDRNQKNFEKVVHHSEEVFKKIKSELNKGKNINNKKILYNDALVKLKTKTFKTIGENIINTYVDNKIRRITNGLLGKIPFNSKLLIGEGEAEKALSEHIGISSYIVYGKPFMLIAKIFIKILNYDKCNCIFLYEEDLDSKEHHKYFNKKWKDINLNKRHEEIKFSDNIEKHCGIDGTKKEFWDLYIETHETKEIVKLINKINKFNNN